MGTGRAFTDGEGRDEAGALRGLGDAFRRFAAELREGFGRPAMNRRILHRLTALDEAALSRIGLTGRDVRDATEWEVADVAAFLAARRSARQRET